MKKLFFIGLSAFLLCGCKATLAPGGAYAPTNSVGQAASAPDLAFYQVDASFDLAFTMIDTAFKIELDNAALLKTQCPKCIAALDGIKPDVVLAIQAYGAARTAYRANPTPAGLSTLQSILPKAQALATSAQAVINTLPKGN